MRTIGPAGMRGATRPAALVALVVLAVLVVAAAQQTAVASATDGLPPGVPVPAWAKGHWVHFDPAEPPRPPSTQGSPSTPRPQGKTAAKARPLTSTTEPLRYYGGPVENEPRLVLVFWGEGWSYGEGPALRRELEAMAEGLPGPGYQKILTQYSSIDGPISPGPLIDSPKVEKYNDPSAVPADLGGEAFFKEGEKVAAVKPPGNTLDTTYAVIPAPGTTYEPGKFCGWHSVVDGPSTTSVELGAVAAILLKVCNPSATLSHEYAESVTDPTAEVAWGKLAPPEEIADPCGYLGPQRMADGSLVNALWDDSKNACEVEDENPAPVPIGPYTDWELEGTTNPSTESETLEAGLEPCGEEAHYYFEYGTTEAYGSRTAEFTLSATWGAVKEGVTIAGLQHSTNYYWRVVVRTSNGTAHSESRWFRIPYYVEAGPEEPGVGTTEATLSGWVEPAGVEAKYHFEYGTTEAYGSSTTEASAGSGVGHVRVNAPITGLAPETLYHYRIVASSSRGTTVSGDQTFTTRGGKPVAETLPATRIGYDEATLWGMVDAKGVPTNVYFEYGTTSAYGQRSFEQSTERLGEEERAAIIRGLTPNTTYHFRVVAANSFGTVDGADQTFTTSETPSVETEAATAVGYNDATLGGAIDPRGTELVYYFEYGTTEAYGSRTAEATAGSGTSEVQEAQTVNGLAEGTTYHFRVVIHNNAPNEYGIIYGADQTFSTGTRPFVQTDASTAVGSTGATLSGTIDPHGTGVEYYFEYGPTYAYGSSTAEASAGSGNGEVQVSKALAGLSPNTTYHCRLVAVSNSIKTYGTDATFTTTPTTTPLTPIVETIGPGPAPNERPPPPAPSQTPTPSPPVVQNARQSATRWREGNQLARISRTKTPTGTTFSFSLDEQATVSFSFTQLLGGPRGAHSCFAKTHKNVKSAICSTATAGTLSFTGHSGTNDVIFAGRLSHTSRLKPGQYELTITATNSTGQRSTPVSLSFTIVK